MNLQMTVWTLSVIAALVAIWMLFGFERRHWTPSNRVLCLMLALFATTGYYRTHHWPAPVKSWQEEIADARQENAELRQAVDQTKRLEHDLRGWRDELHRKVPGP